MAYFRRLPTIQYQNFLRESPSASDYIEVRNLFLRGKLRDDLQVNFTVFDKYEIKGDFRADQVAAQLYGDSSYDWIVRLTANIINYQNEWPLTSQQLYDYCVQKYGLANINEVKYYETTEVKNAANQLILPARQRVDGNFTIPNPDLPAATLNPVTPISNIEFETNLNDQKRNIYVLRPSYVGTFIRDMNDIGTYKINSEFINSKTIRTSNTKVKSP